MLEKFDLIDQKQLNNSSQCLNKFDNPCIEGDEDFFFKINNHIIIYSQKLFTWKDTGEKELFADQIEIPKSGVKWIVDTIETKFFKPPAQGGLPKDIFFHKETIEAEELQINRGVAVGGEGVGGYVLANISRKSHINNRDIQEFPMPDPFLFQHGLMDYLKELAGQIKRGEI